jgi:hypothetical protein
MNSRQPITKDKILFERSRDTFWIRVVKTNSGNRAEGEVLMNDLSFPITHPISLSSLAPEIRGGVDVGDTEMVGQRRGWVSFLASDVEVITAK